MGWADKANVIRSRFSSNWSTTPIAWENVAFTPPEAEPWVRFSILEARTRQADFGNLRKVRTKGLIVVQIFVPAGTGDGLAREYSDTIANIYRAAQFGGVNCWEPEITRVGGDEDGFYWQMNVEVPFYFDEHYA